MSASSNRAGWFVAAGVAAAAILFFVLRPGAEAPAPTIEAASAGGATTPDTIVMLDSAAQRFAGITLITVAANGQNELTVNGTITFDAEHVSVVAPRAEGRLMRMEADLGAQVRAGQVLAIVESSEIGQIRGDLDRARAAVDVAKRNYEREKRLYEQNISSQKEMLEAEVVYRTAEADVRSAQAKLETYGATTGSGGSYGLTSAVAGTVVERNGSPGQIVGPTTNIFTVAALQHLWITVDVYEADFKRVRPEAAVTVFPVALAGESFKGRVLSMGGVVDTNSHTFKVRVSLENPAQRLRPGMFAQVRIQAPASGVISGAVAIPDIAVQDFNGRQVVFVATSEPGRFIVRPVVTGSRTGTGSVIISSGVTIGERVVTTGAFQLKAELLKRSAGEGD